MTSQSHQHVRPELPPMPPRIASLPVDHRLYPVPWFAAWLDDDGNVAARGEGTADHRVLYPDATRVALTSNLCWVCGGRLGAHKTFVIGPMCAVNRVSAEPPSHLECGDWSARACPFLSRPHARRREAGMPGGAVEAPGVMIARNPGVTLVWTTKRFQVERVPNGVLCRIGDPERVHWYAEGRDATRAEVMASIDSGLPSLREAAQEDGPAALRELERMTSAALTLVPA